MSADGPVVAALTHRLSECPSECLDEPRLDGTGTIHVDAVVGDVIRAMGGPLPSESQTELLRTGSGRARRNHLQMVLVASWLLKDPWFAGRGVLAAAVLPLVTRRLASFAELVVAGDAVADPDRREELVRICLSALGVQPDGETDAVSADRLASLDTAARLRVVEETKKAEARARKVKEAMAAKAAEEAAARYGRE